MPSKRDKIQKALSDIKSSQPELANEIEQLRRDDEIVEEARNLAPHIKSPEGGLESAGSRTNFALETIVLKTGRPVLAISQDKPILSFEDAKSKFWKEKLQSASSLLIPSIKAIGRIELENHPELDWVGTGWLIDKSTVVTNRHVASEFGKRSGSKFVFRQGESGKMNASIDFLEEIDRPHENTFQITGILHIEDEDGPDIAFLSASPIAGNNLPQFISLSDAAPVNGQEVVVIGYPAEDSRIPDLDLMRRIFGNVYNKKRLAPGITKGIKQGNLLHDCSTLGGNSGSAVLDLKTGKAIGLHFAGRYLESNFAVPAITIKERLNNFNRRPPGGAARGIEKQPNNNGGGQAITTATSSQDQQRVSGYDNVLDVTIPIHISVRIGNASGNSQYKDGSADSGTTIAGTEEQEEFITEGNPADYADREGYDPDFLEETAPLPIVKSAEKKKDILKFGDNESELKYRHFSVVMSKSRRQCFFSAVNIDGESSVGMKRQAWRTDPRIDEDAQIMKECYGDFPKYSRGHMTRREDPIWGDAHDAKQGNTDSMHVTNTVPQIQVMNAGIWLKLENYALQNAIKDDQRISVFTGPVFKASDTPTKHSAGVTVPRSFWKVIAFIHDETEKLCATGYTISQEDFINKSDQEFIFGKHGAAQVSIRSIERHTGLSFGKLTGLDPFDKETESLGGPVAPLKDLNEIRFV